MCWRTDGHDDVAVINQAITHEWIVTPNVTPTSVSYDLTVFQEVI
ncbi:MAG: hypothetical protein R2807_04810 [Chitinophagales bacterium]